MFSTSTERESNVICVELERMKESIFVVFFMDLQHMITFKHWLKNLA